MKIIIILYYNKKKNNYNIIFDFDSFVGVSEFM